MVRVALRAPGVRTTGALPRLKPAMAPIVLRGLAVVAFSWLGLSGCAPREAPARLAVAAGDDSRPGIAGLLRGDDAGFARAQRRREFSFPADHGAHPAFRTEWWYVTGHLAGDDVD